jgi:hypothetical protein
LLLHLSSTAGGSEQKVIRILQIVTSSRPECNRAASRCIRT